MSLLITMSSDGVVANAAPESDTARSIGSLPYGVAIAVGSVITLMLNA
jgi:Flp pilus assembly protein protease CpaA